MKKVLLLGDQIRVGYQKYVEMALFRTDDETVVYLPQNHDMMSTYLLRWLPTWCQRLEIGDSLDLVHFNVGLWDCKIMEDGKHLVPLSEYKKNINRICKIIKRLYPEAKIVFATTTPVLENLCKNRINNDIEKYNKAAVEVINDNGGVINDLYALMKDAQRECYSDAINFRTKEGTNMLATQVTKKIASELQVKTNFEIMQQYLNMDFGI